MCLRLLLDPSARHPLHLQVTILHYDGRARPTTYGVQVGGAARRASGHGCRRQQETLGMGAVARGLSSSALCRSRFLVQVGKEATVQEIMDAAAPLAGLDAR